MENKNIETYYKNIYKQIIDNYVNNLNLKKLLSLSTTNDLYLFTKKKKNEWKLKNKSKKKKKSDIKKKKKIKKNYKK